MSIGPYGQKGVVRTIRSSASSGVNVTSRMRSRSMTERPISGSSTAWSAFKIASCFSASATIAFFGSAGFASLVDFVSSATGRSFPALPSGEPCEQVQRDGDRETDDDRRREGRVQGPAITLEREVAGQASEERNPSAERHRDAGGQDDQPRDDEQPTSVHVLIVSPSCEAEGYVTRRRHASRSAVDSGAASTKPCAWS